MHGENASTAQVGYEFKAVELIAVSEDGPDLLYLNTAILIGHISWGTILAIDDDDFNIPRQAHRKLVPITRCRLPFAIRPLSLETLRSACDV
jgi:hypothetical protein